VADVGCGPAVILVELARLVGPHGTAVGVERDAEARAIASERLAAEGLEHARVIEGDAGATGLPRARNYRRGWQTRGQSGVHARLLPHRATHRCPHGHTRWKVVIGRSGHYQTVADRRKAPEEPQGPDAIALLGSPWE
jgi:hypothetical protein